jgi:hypothetical protein
LLPRAQCSLAIQEQSEHHFVRVNDSSDERVVCGSDEFSFAEGGQTEIERTSCCFSSSHGRIFLLVDSDIASFSIG